MASDDLTLLVATPVMSDVVAAAGPTLGLRVVDINGPNLATVYSAGDVHVTGWRKTRGSTSPGLLMKPFLNFVGKILAVELSD